jgi:tetratricopeptide (TPR) repeat protein
MSIRFRRSVKLIPGVRLNFSKSTVGLSFGVPGARYTINSKGRRTVSAGLPGTGLYATQTLSSGRKSKSAAAVPQKTREEEAAERLQSMGSVIPTPGVFAGKAERALSKFLLDVYHRDHPDSAEEVLAKAKALRAEHDDLRYPLELVTFLHSITDDNARQEALGWADGLWSNRSAIFADKLVIKYLSAIYPQTRVTRGIWTFLPYNQQLLGFIYVEVLQDQDKFAEALKVLGEMGPDPLISISTADIEIAMKDFQGAIETTEDVENEDDVTAMLLTLRGVAFRGLGRHEAALECFKRALAKKDRSQEILHRARFERADTYLAMGKKSMAIKDLEKILVDNPEYEGVTEKLDELDL